MISIILASANPLLLTNVLKNIEQTIGVAFEIISFENGNGERGICEIYNRGAQRAKYDMLCYMHEDIEIKTQDWGIEVLRIFNQRPEAGVIGVVGSAFKSQIPSGWYAESYESDIIFCNYLQSFKSKNKPTVHHYINPEPNDLATVVCVDGMWFCTPKKVALENPFDEQLLQGFHGYDIDYCLQVNQKYEVLVTFNILMEHFSEGGYTRAWLEDTIKLHAKWQSSLPRSVKAVSETDRLLIEKRTYKWLLKKFIGMDYSLSEIHLFLNKLRMERELSLSQYLKYLFYAGKYMLKKEKLLNA